MATASPAQESAWIILDEMFRSAVDHPVSVNWRVHTDTAYRFEQGDQWSSTEKAVLKDRNQPAIVENEIRPAVERLLGKFRRQKTTVKFLGRNPQDEPIAQAQSDLLRHIDNVNGFEWTEGEITRDMLIGGVGWLEACIHENELGQPQVRYRREDPFTIFVDPFSRAFDLSDARFICRSKWLYQEEAELLWPKKSGLIAQCLGNEASGSVHSILDPEVLTNRNWWHYYFDSTKRRFRPVEIWYKQRATEYLVTLPDGRTAKPDLPKEEIDRAARRVGATVEPRSVDELWVAVYCGHILLDGPKKSPYRCNKFPFIPYYAYRCADGEPQGYVWNLLDPQREINARRSKAIWALNNRQTIYERNAIRDPVELANEMAKMDGQVVIEPGKFEKFMVKENDDITQGNLSMLQEAKMAIRRTVGEDQLNPAPEIRSARGLQRIEAQQQDAVLTLADHVRLARRQKALLTHALVQQFYTDEMIFQVTDDPGIVRTVRLTADHFETIKSEIYDLVVADSQDHLNSSSEQLELLATTLPQVIQYGPQWAQLLIQLMPDLKNKQGVLQILESMSQKPPADPKIGVQMQWDTLPPEEKVAWAMRWQMPELAQAIAQAGRITTPELKAKEGIAKQQIKAQADITKAEIAHQGKQLDHHAKLETAAMAAHVAMNKPEPEGSDSAA